jgi:hypothetical protein
MKRVLSGLPESLLLCTNRDGGWIGRNDGDGRVHQSFQATDLEIQRIRHNVNAERMDQLGRM